MNKFESLYRDWGVIQIPSISKPKLKSIYYFISETRLEIYQPE